MRKDPFITSVFNWHDNPCNNPVCRKCFWFGRGSISCDYYLYTGKRKKGLGKTCDSFLSAKKGLAEETKLPCHTFDFNVLEAKKTIKVKDDE